MSVEVTDKVDFVSIDAKSFRVLLTISDHLDWAPLSLEYHLTTLQEKLNCYLRFIESGELIQRFPDATGMTPVISLISKFPPKHDGSAIFGACL